jgi:hypothetical protein
MPGGRGNIKPSDRTNGFEKNPQNINKKGRPRKSFSEFNEKCKNKGVAPLSQSEYIETLSFLYQLTEEEIKELADDKEQPLALRLIIAELTDPQSRGKTLQELRDYLFHKGIKQTDITSKGEKVNAEPVWIIQDNSKKDE